MPTQLVRLGGQPAADAWHGYRENKSGASHDEQNAWKGIADVESITLTLPAAIIAPALQVRELGKNAMAALVVGKSSGPLAHRTHPLRHVHVRQIGRGQGHSDEMLEQFKDSLPPGASITAQAAACHTWFGTLLLLRNGFVGDMAIFTADIRKPGERTARGSHLLTMRWSDSVDAAEHKRFLQAVHAAQSARRSVRAREYTEELRAMLERLYP